MQNRLVILIFCSLLLSVNSVGQNTLSEVQEESAEGNFKLEFNAIPLVFFNHLNAGVSYRTPGRLEHCFKIGASYEMIRRTSFNLNVLYSLNAYFRNRGMYVPVWFQMSNTRNDLSHEDGYHPHTLRYSIGTGFGKCFEINHNWGVRMELGLGAAVNLTNAKGEILTFDLDLNDYSRDITIPEQNPFIIPTFRLGLSMVRNLYR